MRRKYIRLYWESVGTSDEYRDRPLKNQKLDVPKVTVYVGNEIKEFDAGVEKYSPEIEKRRGRILGDLCGNDRKQVMISGHLF